MKKVFILASIVIVNFHCCMAQFTDSLIPQIGRPCPDFTLNVVQNNETKKVSRSDMKGQWFILDFWSHYCGGCIHEMPETNMIQHELGEKIHIYLVGLDDPYIRPLFENLKKYKKIDLPIAYDSVVWKKFRVASLPYQMVVDDKGIVRAITTKIKKAELDTFLSGGDPQMDVHPIVLMSKKSFIFFDRSKPFGSGGNGNSVDNYIYQSFLTRWSPGMDYLNEEFRGVGKWSNFSDFGIQDIGISVPFLYRIAYQGKLFLLPDDSLYGRFWQFPILQMKDSSLFSFDGATGKNMFCYSLIVPKEKATDSGLQYRMRADLKNYFGYEIVLEERIMPYWKLVATPQARVRLKTKGAKTDFAEYMQPVEFGFTLTNRKVMEILYAINGIGDYYSGPPIMDETGITDNIDITLQGDLSNFSDLKKTLNDNGLDLIKSEKRMTVMIIRDPSESISGGLR